MSSPDTAAAAVLAAAAADADWDETGAYVDEVLYGRAVNVDYGGKPGVPSREGVDSDGVDSDDDDVPHPDAARCESLVRTALVPALQARGFYVLAGNAMPLDMVLSPVLLPAGALQRYVVSDADDERAVRQSARLRVSVSEASAGDFFDAVYSVGLDAQRADADDQTAALARCTAVSPAARIDVYVPRSRRRSAPCLGAV